MANDVTWQGLDTLQAILKEAPSNGDKWLRNEMFDTANDAFNESQRQVPVRYGALRGSGTVQVTGDQPFEVTIGYGGSSASYALWVHENLAAHHKAPTKAKYLEDPVKAAMQGKEGEWQNTVEGAIIGHIPGAASAAQQGEMAGMVKGAGAGRHRRGRRSPRPMTEHEIHNALNTIDRGKKLARQGRRGIQTWHRRGG